MRRITIGSGLVVIVLAVLGSQLLMSRASEAPQYAPADPVIIDDIYGRINRLRERRGLPPYQINQSLMLAAQDQAVWLVATGIRAHFRPDGSRPSTRAMTAGYVTNDWCCGENYYLSIDATPDMVWDFWIWSPHHYLNLVHPRFDEVGLGWSTNGRRISYVLVFGNRPDAGEPLPTPIPTVVPGESLQLAAQTGYIVQPGETLLSIAQRYGTSVEALAAANGLSDPALIYAGQRLVIPGTAPAPLPIGLERIIDEGASEPPTAPDTGQLHVVQPGETLFRIAQRYGTSMQAIIAANSIANPNALDVGQELMIPNAGSGFAGLPAGAAALTAPVAVVSGACSGLWATSPTDGFPNGMTTFYWNAPAGGVSGYVVEVFNEGGQRIASYRTGAGVTSLTGDMSSASIGRGVTFSWDVVALLNDEPACTSQRITALRESSTE